MAQPLSLSRAASASPQLASAGNILTGDLLSVQPFMYNTLPRTDKRNHYNFWKVQQTTPPGSPGVIYSTTDPHFLSALTTTTDPSTATITAAIDPQDSSWSSDHLYCNMASVDPLPNLPPRISRRCHSLLALVPSKPSIECEDADYENLQPEVMPSFQHRLNVSHNRSQSLRHSGDFSLCWPPSSLVQQQQELQRTEPRMSSRRQQLMLERANRLELMLNDASLNDYADTYEPSDWSMEAMLSDTVRDLDSVSLAEHKPCHHCCCPPARRPPLPLPRCCAHHDHSALRVKENAATQTESSSPSGRIQQHRIAAAENPLYMAYNDLTKIDDYEDPAAKPSSAVTAEDYASDGCETWNSHRALYAKLQAAKKREAAGLLMESPKKTRAGRIKPTLTPSTSRIWRHQGQTVSTPQKTRHRSGGGSRRRAPQSANTTLDRTALSVRSQASRRRSHRSQRKPKAADVLHGKGQLQLAIYLNSGLLTIHGT